MRIERMTLYHCPLTRSARVKWLLHELVGDDFDVVRLALYEGEQLRPEFLTLNPNHAVPTLVIHTSDGERLVMFESGAIVTLLADLHPEKRLAPPPAPLSPARADYLQMIHFCGATIDMILWQMRMNLDLLPAAQRHEATVERYRKKFAAEVEPQLRHRLASRPYICGEAFTGADCMVAHAIRWSRRYGLCDDRAIDAYLSRLAERPAYRQVFEEAPAFRRQGSEVAPPVQDRLEG